jgi:Tfp pilus assembly PilM family ATPase
MSRLLALEWDSREARVAVARRRSDGVVIEHIFSVPLDPREGAGGTEGGVGAKIASALEARGVGRVLTLVAVGRASIELRRMSLPPAPDGELPELVRFQALRQFTTLSDDWPLDFVPMEGPSEGPRTVLAAAISPDLVSQIRQTCDEAGLTPRHLVLRPFAAASLFLRRTTTDTRVRLMVDLLADEADLTVLSGDSVVLVRTARLPGEPNTAEQGRALTGEIRRTIAAAQNQLGGGRVESVVLFGSENDHATLKPQLEDDLSLPVRVFDPLAGLETSGEAARRPPGHAGRFAPLIGMLLDEAAGSPHAIDFLMPRRRPAPPDRRWRYAAIGGSIAAAILLIGGGIWLRVATLDAHVESLRDEWNMLAADVRQSRQLRQAAAELDRWECGDVGWLDELRELSLEAPPADDLRLTQLYAAARSEGGGDIVLKGFVRASPVITAMEQALRDQRHRVLGKGGSYDGGDEKYPWQYEGTLVADPPADAPCRQGAPRAAPQAASAGNASSTATAVAGGPAP